MIIQFLWYFLIGSSTSFGYSEETKDVVSRFTNETYKVSVLTPDEANQLFKKFQTNSMIPYYLVSDGCYERAYQMTVLAKLKNVQMGKTVAEVLNPEVAVIEVPQKNNPWILRWQYHVAPYLFIRSAGGVVEKHIFDPSLFEKPVTEIEFVKKLTQDSKVNLDVFDLPPYVLEKNQINADVDLRRYDSAMLQSMMAAKEKVEIYGVYFEKVPLLDLKQNKCYQGGHLVDRSLCGPQ